MIQPIINNAADQFGTFDYLNLTVNIANNNAAMTCSTSKPDLSWLNTPEQSTDKLSVYMDLNKNIKKKQIYLHSVNSRFASNIERLE